MNKWRKMKERFRMYRRGETYYAQCNRTGRQQSLKTKDKEAATAMLAGMNGAAKSPQNHREVALATLGVCDPAARNRIWNDVFQAYAASGEPQTQERKKREFNSQHYATILDKLWFLKIRAR
ncbi:MAG: hypothetical protein ACO39V_09955 [Arenicellales bacterium]